MDREKQIERDRPSPWVVDWCGIVIIYSRSRRTKKGPICIFQFEL